MPQEPGPSPSEIVRAVSDVLSSSDFQARPLGVSELLWQWTVEQVLEPVGEFLRTLFGGMSRGGLEAAAVVVVFAAAAWSGWRAARAWAAARRHRRAAESPDGGGGSLRAPEEWARLAAARAAAGQFRRAATALYLEMLARLDQMGALSFHASKTPADYAREVARRPGSGGAQEFLGAFQALAFGRTEPTPSAYGRLEALARRSGRDQAGGRRAAHRPHADGTASPAGRGAARRGGGARRERDGREDGAQSPPRRPA